MGEGSALLQDHWARSEQCDGRTNDQCGRRKCGPKKTKRGVDLRFIRYLWKVLRLMFPTWRSATLLLCIFLVIARAVEEFTVYNAGLVPSMFYGVIDSRDLKGFKRVLWQSALAVASAAVSKTASQWVAGILYVRWRALITRGLQQLYFKDILYYQLRLEEQGIDNPDQRLTQDVDKFCQELKKVAPQVVIAPFVIAYYTYVTYASMGFYGPLSIFAFAFLAAFLNKFLMGPVVRAVCTQEAREGDFRFHHVQFRMHSESVAFYRGGSIEGRNAARNLSALTAAQSSVIHWGLPLSLSVNIFDYSGAILSYCLIGVPVFAGMYDSLDVAALSALISKNAFVSLYLINNCTTVLDLSSNLSDLAGYTHRIGELLCALKQLDAQTVHDAQTTDNHEDKESSSDTQESDGRGSEECVGVDVKHLSVTPPGWNAPLLKDVSFKLEAGENILIVGENGFGKSSLLRVISGLWKAQEGSFNVGVCYGPNGLFVLPQTTYLTTGSLADQVAFPELAKDAEGSSQPCYGCGHGVDRTTEALQMAGLVSCSQQLHLRDRLGGVTVPLKSGQNWYDYVSPGESQCISFARLFFHHPQFAILDEATSSLSEANEEHMYCMLKMLRITYMTIGHRSSLKQYHDVVLHLTEDGCSLEAVDQETEEAVVSVTDTAIGQHHGIQRICM